MTVTLSAVSRWVSATARLSVERLKSRIGTSRTALRICNVDGWEGSAMSKSSRRPNREKIKAQRKERKRAQRVLREELKGKGFNISSHSTISNHKCEFRSVEEEGAARNEAVLEQLKVFRGKLPVLLGRLSKIPDPRNPKKTKHKLTVLLIYGILVFVMQMSSSREANREMTRPMFWENLKLVFPKLEDVPHHDTLLVTVSRTVSSRDFIGWQGASKRRFRLSPE